MNFEDTDEKFAPDPISTSELGSGKIETVTSAPSGQLVWSNVPTRKVGMVTSPV